MHYGSGDICRVPWHMAKAAYCTRQKVCRVQHTINHLRYTMAGKGAFCRGSFFGHTIKGLLSAKKHSIIFSENLYLNRKQKRFNPRSIPPASHSSAPSKSQVVAFFVRYALVEFEPSTSLLRVTSSTTRPHTHLCLYSIFFPPHIILN